MILCDTIMPKDILNYYIYRHVLIFKNIYVNFKIFFKFFECQAMLNNKLFQNIFWHISQSTSNQNFLAKLHFLKKY